MPQWQPSRPGSKDEPALPPGVHGSNNPQSGVPCVQSQHFPAVQKSSSKTEENRMEKYIHRENLNLLRSRLAEAQDEATRRMISKLLAEEEAKDFAPPKEHK